MVLSVTSLLTFPTGCSQNRTHFLTAEKQADPNDALQEKCAMVSFHDRLYTRLLEYINKYKQLGFYKDRIQCRGQKVI